MVLTEITSSGSIKETLQTGSWTLIADSGTVASQAAFDTNTILGGSIPATYKHLKLLFSSRSDSTTGFMKLQINNDTGSNYRFDPITWAGVTLLAATTYLDLGNGTAWCHSSSASEAAGSFELTFPDYAQATNKKRIMGVVGVVGNTTIYVGGAGFGTWNSTAAINRIAVSLTAGNFTEARFTLYGLN